MSVKYISSGLFKSDGVWQHPKRIIDSYEIIFMHEGTAFICEEESEYILKKNDILVLEPGKLHYGFKESVEFVSFSWLHFKALKERYKNLPKHIEITEPYILKNLLSQCLHTANTPSYSSVCNDLYTALIIEEILTMEKAQSVPGKYLSVQIKEWIRVNIEKDITIGMLAKEIGYHENHISRVFKEAYSVGLKNYITEMRLENVKNLLSTTLYTIKQIAGIMSFKSENHLIKFFKYHMNMTPTEYRNTYVNIKINKK